VADLYVATDPEGRERRAGTDFVWPLPHVVGNSAMAGEPVDADVVLYEPRGLLGRLDERVWLAAAREGFDAAMAAVYAAADTPASETGRLHVTGARLLAPTGWDGFMAAGFALDCAEHAMGAAADVALPDGMTLGAALDHVREWLADAEAHEGHGGKLHDLALGRRLRREGNAIGDAASKLAEADLTAHVDALEDPIWTAVEAARDAVLAAVEAVQHALFPRLREREAHHYEAADEPHHADPAADSRVSFVPSWIAADDAAELARQAAGDAGGDAGATAELDWQAGRLAELLTA
jgi:hypothetical protein